MSLVPGTRLGPYEVLAPIGAGGMGQVWSARDTRLDRTVAIKVSGEQFTERFEREARNVAALNHPNICTLFDVGPDYLVMELIEGPTLAQRLAAGPMPLAEALDVARQIAEALEAAHERGIVHRDLKPANVKITHDGKVKVLDFGLAKARDPESKVGDPAVSPTLTLSATQAGVILGTAGYMSPEQARGKPVDRRADIWSFGVVLYEMIAGQRLYGGELASDMLAAVILKDPDWSVLPAATPLKIRELLERCLRKDPKMRLRDIGDARIAIEEYLEKPEKAAPVQATPAAGMPIWLAAIAALLAIFLGALAWIHFREAPPDRAVLRYEILPPDKTSYGNGMAISPDGKKLAFVAGEAGRGQLWVRTLDSVVSQALPDTESATFPFWSPDSRMIGFFAPGKLKAVDSAGGVPHTICDVPNTGIGASWSATGVIAFGTNATGLFRVPDVGGAATPLTTLDPKRNESYQGRVWFLPDGLRYLSIRVSAKAEFTGIYLDSLDHPAPRRIVETSQGAAYVPPGSGNEKGHLLYLRDTTLMAQPVEPGTFQFVGAAYPIAEHVGSNISNPFFTVSTNGVLIYRRGGAGLNTQLEWFDRSGTSLALVGPLGLYTDVALSPDGSRVASAKRDVVSNLDIWMTDVARGTHGRFTFDPALDRFPVWSPDGSRLIFSSTRGDVENMYVKNSDGTGSEELLLKSSLAKNPTDWSEDGRYLLFSVIDPNTKSDLWVLSDPGAKGEPKAQPFLATPFAETQGQFSPGKKGPRWVAYTAFDTGRPEVYVQGFADGGPAGGKFQISTNGGVQPRWRRDGKELFYISSDTRLMAVDVSIGPQFEHSNPKPLFQTRMFGGAVPTGIRYSPAPDGQRFLINSQAAEEGAVPLTVVLNWTAAAKR